MSKFFPIFLKKNFMSNKKILYDVYLELEKNPDSMELINIDLE